MRELTLCSISRLTCMLQKNVSNGTETLANRQEPKTSRNSRIAGLLCDLSYILGEDCGHE
jgi:hypothetical protein